MARKFPYSLTFASGACTGLSNDNIQVTDLPASLAAGAYTFASVTIDSAGRVTAASSGAVFVASGASHATGIVPDPGATAGTHKLLREDATWVDAVMPTTVEGRLTLATGTPVPQSNQSGKTTVFYTPFIGNRIALYNGTAWQEYAVSEISVAVPSTTTTGFDVFIYDNAGTVTLETVNWTNDTTRTALATQDGILVKTGTTTKRYLGSGRTTAVSGQCSDTASYRGLANYYNRVPRYLYKTEDTATANWTYTTATYRAANGASNNKVEVLSCTGDTAIELMVSSTNINSLAAARTVGIGEDSTSTDSSQVAGATGDASAALGNSWAILNKTPGFGYHAYTWLEWSNATGVTTWYGAPIASALSGITGMIMA